MRFAAFLLLLGLALPVSAQDASARAHFERGVELFDEGRYVQALAEFEEAYRISPRPAVLYNIAQLHAELGRSVEAVAAYEEFLATGEVDAALRGEVEDALERERARIGSLVVTVSAGGARVSLDDVEIGVSPLGGPVPVSAGEHVVIAQAEGFETVRHRFRIAGGQTVTVELAMVASGSLGSSVRITSRLPGVDVRIDGISRGLTPLDSTVPLSPGTHVIEGVREGYTRFAQNIDLPAGAESTVAIVIERDPSAPAASRSTLDVELPAATTTIRIDGEAVPSDAMPLEVVVGLHDVEIRVGERETVSTRIDVESGVPYELEPGWVWTPDAREARLAAARGQRELGWGLFGGGAAALVLGVGTIIGARVWWDSELGPFRSTISACNLWTLTDTSTRDACVAGLMRFDPPLTGDPMRQAGIFTAANMGLADDNLSAYYALLTGGIVLGALGAVGMIVGGVLVGGAPDERAIDRAARASLRLDLGPGGLQLSGMF